MVDSITTACRLLPVVAVLAVAVVPSIRGDCAAVDQNCYCGREDSRNYLFCQDLGNISQVPSISPSSTVYYVLWIGRKTTGTTLSTVQTGAFNGMKVQEIHLSSIGITAIQSGAFSNLSDVLELLNLHQNKLETIPENSFDGLNQLKTLFLSNNLLKTVSTAWFSQLPALEHLSLSGNQLDTIPDKAFNKLHKLKKLELSSNRLKTVSAAWFSQLTALETLDLSLNWFEEIPDDAFEGLTQLKTLRLNHYRLKTLSHSLVQNKSHLELLTLYGNLLECDCRMAWVRTKAAILDHRYTARCASPSLVKGTPVVDYDISMCAVGTTVAASTATSSREKEDTTVSLSTQDSTAGKEVTPNSGGKEHVGRIYYLLTIVLATFSVALVSGILIYLTRVKCAKCRTTVDDVDAYTHPRPGEVDLTPAVYDTIAAVPKP